MIDTLRTRLRNRIGLCDRIRYPVPVDDEQRGRHQRCCDDSNDLGISSLVHRLCQNCVLPSPKVNSMSLPSMW